MERLRVHELASELGRQNREIMEFLKFNGMNVKSHMSIVEEPYISMVKKRYGHMGKEQKISVDTPRNEENKMTNKPAAENAGEAPKKKKNIIRVYHAQNASDGGKNRPRRPVGERKPGVRPAGAERRPASGVRPQGTPAPKGTGEELVKNTVQRTEPVKPAPKEETVKAAVRTEAPKTETPKTEAPKTEAPKVEVPKAEASKAESPKAEAPKNEGSKSEVLKTEAPKTEAPKAEAPKAEAPKMEAAKKEMPESQTPKNEVPKKEMPKTEAPKTEAPKTETPKAEAVKEEAPKAEISKAASPKTESVKAAEGTADGKQNRFGQENNREGRSSRPVRDGRSDTRAPRENRDGNRENRDGSREYRDGNREYRDGNREYRDGNREKRDGNRESRGRDNRNNEFRSGEGRNYQENRRGDRPFQNRNGEGRPVRNADGGNRPQRPQGQGRPTGGTSSRPQGGMGRQDNRMDGRGTRDFRDNRADMRDKDKDNDGRENRFGGNNQGGRGGNRQGTRRNDGDVVFTPELTKTSKDSKRERDRENKNKKKDFENTQGNGRKPNQGGRKVETQLPKALQKPTPQPKQEEKKPEIREITLPEKMTIRELADAMKMQPSVIVKKLFMQGMMVTVNHEIDFEKAQEIALDYDIVAEPEVKVDVIEELLKEEEESEETMIARPPVVCVMGHVDHGKTSLLDAIRNTNVTRGEAGGITQHIGASVVSINGQNITFLDTPGHEAFTAMRMRGANSTDIAVLVVAADDGVMPQTIEAISHAKAAGVEIIVAINKIDKPSANIDRVKQELTEYGLIAEDWGGSTACVPVSAHTGEGIDDLLEMILLTAEVSELKANPNRAARGLVIEAKLDKGKGPVATILIQKGTLHQGDFIAAGACSGKVRAMMDDKGRRVKEAGPSTPVEILGLNDVPNAGEVLMSFDTDKDAKSFAGAFVSENKNRLLEETKAKLSLDNLFDQIQASDLKELPLIVKADVQGSVEAVKQSLLKLSNEEVVIRVIHGGVGAINESDVTLAATSNAIIIGFNVRPDALAKQLAEQENVDLRLYRVIYQAIEDIEAAMKGMLDPIYEEKIIGHAEIRQTFKASGVGTIAGSYVLDGIFQRNCKVRISREGEQIYEGALASLKRFKDDVKEVRAGYECGLVFDGFNDLKEEDRIEAYIMVEVPR